MKDFYIQKILQLAYRAAAAGEIPVGAIIVDTGEAIIAEGYNQTEKKKSQLGHAEIIAIEGATKKKGDWRLSDCDLYVTLEPCMMCFGLIHLSRIKKVIYLADSLLFTTKPLHGKKYANHTCIIEQYPENTEYSMFLKAFFKNLRHID